MASSRLGHGDPVDDGGGEEDEPPALAEVALAQGHAPDKR
jgi:hypothetical protein